MGGDSCRANDCKFPASRCGLDMISDLMGLLLLLTSLAFFIYPSNILIFSVFLKLPLGPIISEKKGELRIILLTLLG